MTVNPNMPVEYQSLPYYYFNQIPINFTGQCLVKNGLGGEYFSWFKQGKLHREDGPAQLSLDGWSYQCWYNNGAITRLDGPAKTYYSGLSPPTNNNKHNQMKIEIYCIDQSWISKEEFMVHPKVLHNKIDRILKI